MGRQRRVDVDPDVDLLQSSTPTSSCCRSVPLNATLWDQSTEDSRATELGDSVTSRKTTFKII
ncbi:hypothetical protein EYF80_004537 [Liparis tanakae]|uniref:Uncharacterized protein n=1 Tax=Liparis tanakae TaxID=230148 RepID=A0A4Z2J592_9TELE|nr:hypothetical protein EYF80_004537 [Liparis tanakae]